MNRSLVILLGALTLGAAVFTGSYFAGRQASLMPMAHRLDDLDWLRQEYHLSDAQMAQIRQIHQNYMPKCAQMCMQLAAKQRELENSLASATNINADARQKLVQLAEYRAQCQARMLQNFIAVSKVMPPAEGRRYLADMKRLVFGFHQELNHSLSEPASHEHHQ